MKNIIYIVFICFSVFLSANSQLIPLQGVLKKANGDKVTGDIQLRFGFFSQQTGGIALWEELRDNFMVEDGYIALYLGEITDMNNLAFDDVTQLWLEVQFNDEVMPRVQIGSMPFALKAIKAQQIGSLSKEQVEHLFNQSCENGYYMKGYQANGQILCAKDLKAATTEPMVLQSSDSVQVNEADEVTLVENLYNIGFGIDMSNEELEISKDVSRIEHNHDNLYYKKVSTPDENLFLKLKLNVNQVNNIDNKYQLTTSSNDALNIVKENAGTLEVKSLNVEEKIKGLDGNIDTIEGSHIGENGGIQNIIGKNLKGNINADLINLTSSALGVKKKNGTNEEYLIKPLSQYHEYIDDEPNCLDQYFHDGDSRCYKKANISSNGTNLTSDNAYCGLSRMYLEGLNKTWEYVACQVILESGNWKLEINNHWGRVRCGVSCLTW